MRFANAGSLSPDPIEPQNDSFPARRTLLTPHAGLRSYASEERAVNMDVYCKQTVKEKRTQILSVLDAKKAWLGFLRHLKILARLSTSLVKIHVLLTDIPAYRWDGIWYNANGKLWQNPKPNMTGMLCWGGGPGFGYLHEDNYVGGQLRRARAASGQSRRGGSSWWRRRQKPA